MSVPSPCVTCVAQINFNIKFQDGTGHRRGVRTALMTDETRLWDTTVGA